MSGERGFGETLYSSAEVGFEDVSVEFTHGVADGMHAAIVKAVKTTEPQLERLPVVQPAARAGCC